MRKVFSVFLFGCLLIESSWAASIDSEAGSLWTPGLVRTSGNDSGVNRPHVSYRCPSSQLSYDVVSDAVQVSSSSEADLVQAIFDFSDSTILPISGEPGIWAVYLFPFDASGAESEFEF